MPHTHQGFVSSSTTSNDTDHASSLAAHNLLGTGWELDTGLAFIGVVADNGGILIINIISISSCHDARNFGSSQLTHVSTGSSQRTTVTNFLFNI
jgi:hypothetical protein